MMKRNRKGDTTDLMLSHQTSLVGALTAPVAGALRCRTQDMSYSSTTNNTATSLRDSLQLLNLAPQEPLLGHLCAWTNNNKTTQM